MIVSLCVIALNEENTIGKLLEQFLQQDYPHDQIEVVMVDGNSDDRTYEYMQKFRDEHNEEFHRILLLSNPNKKLPCGWNVLLKEFSGDVVLKVDAHAEIPNDFVRKNVSVLEEGEVVVGGQRPNIIDEETKWKKTLLLAESSMFGSSIAAYRRAPERGYIDSVFHGAYRREVFAKIGGFNENLWRTEDNEINYRIRKNGFKICFEPSIISYQHVRSSLKTMLKQKYANGYWIGLTSGVCPGCLSVFHFVPFLFIMGIVLTSVLACFGYPLLSMIMWALYWLAAITMSVAGVVKEKKNVTMLLLPILFFLLHVSYGIGTLVGLVKMPFWRRKNKVCDEIGCVQRVVAGGTKVE